MSPTDSRLTLHRLETESAAEDLLSQAMDGRAIVQAHPQLEVICDLLRKQGAAAAVWQRNIQDPDFLAEHAAYYARWTYKVPRFGSRLHFFGSEPESDDVLDAIEGWSTDGETYLGFVTLRPIAQSPVGATFLRRPHQDDLLFVHAQDSYPVNLAGCGFAVEATPFMQQDNAVGACAQAAIWMALRTLRWREGRSALNPAQITSSATRFVVNGRTLPNRQGLRIEQITEVIRSAGYSPHVIQLRTLSQIKDEPLDTKAEGRIYRQLYPYVESGIPILLALARLGSGHAVVIIGHAWDANTGHQAIADSTWPAPNVTFFDASNWARPFLVHNDNSGPYLQLQSKAEGDYALEHAAWAIPLLSADILVDAEEARAACMNLLAELMTAEGVISWPEKVIVRTRLLSRARLRADALAADGYPGLKRYYRMKWLPSYVWLVEFYDFAGYAGAPHGQACKLADVVLEPNADPKDGHFLAAIAYTPVLPDTAPGPLIFDRDPFGGNIQVSFAD
ncbi:MAG: hypothetical protein WBG92_01035 [Thiohalocapsa sp.]